MQTDSNSTGSHGPEVNHSAPAAAELTTANSTGPRKPRSDRSGAKLRVVDAGSELVASDGDRRVSDLEAAREASIRGRILSGAYDSIEVVDAVARRLLASGDL
jgi:hypothetical protein